MDLCVWEHFFPHIKQNPFSSRGYSNYADCVHMSNNTCACAACLMHELTFLWLTHMSPKGAISPCTRPAPLCAKKGGGFSSAGPPDGITPSRSVSVVGRGKPGYKLQSPGVWLQNQRGRPAAAATELSAMIVIRGLRCSLNEAVAGQPLRRHWSRTHIQHTHTHTAHAHTLKSRTLA